MSINATLFAQMAVLAILVWFTMSFIWPPVTSGTVALTPAQLSMLLEGIDWRRPVRSYDPQMAV